MSFDTDPAEDIEAEMRKAFAEKDERIAELERELAECENAALEKAAKMCEWYASWSKGPNKIDIELHKCAEAIRKRKR